MTFVDPFLLVISLIICILMIIGNLYFLAHYSHHADNGFGSSAFCKFIIMVSYILAQCQVFLLALDATNAREGTNIDMFTFWQIIYMTSLFFVVIIIPFSYFFYESDEDMDYKSRFCTAFRNTLIYSIIFSIIHFPMFVGLRYADIPINTTTYLGLKANRTVNDFNNIFL